MIKSSIHRTFRAEIGTVWGIVTNNAAYDWRSDIARIVMTDDLHFTEYDNRGFPTHFTITAKNPPAEYILAFENANINGIWTGRFTALDSKTTQLDFTEEVEVRNPVMRLLARPYLKIQQKRYMRDLRSALPVSER